MPDLLHQPHHDGSPTYVDNEAPRLGETVRVRMRSHVDDPIEGVWLRTTYDAEPMYLPMRRAPTSHDVVGERPPGAQPGDALPLPDRARRRPAVAGRQRPRRHRRPGRRRLQAQLLRPGSRLGARRCRLPDLPRPVRALGAMPTSGRPRTGRRPAQWTDTVVFEGSDPRTPLQFFGGDLDGITEHLDHVARVGADIVYTTPVFPGESNHRYNATTFAQVDPLLGGDAAYERLTEAVHARGWRILGDLTTNHTGDTHEWFIAGATTRRADADLLLLQPRRLLRELDGPRHPAQGQPRRPRPALGDGRGTRLGRRRAGCSRPTTWTAGASTSPT